MESCKLNIILLEPKNLGYGRCLHSFHMSSDEQGQSLKYYLDSRSLKARLEAYYSLIAPDAISNGSDWGTKFEQIYTKYGYSYEGERKLASKLAKKYGDTVRLLVAQPRAEFVGNRRGDETVSKTTEGDDDRGESWYELRLEERNSLDINFVSNRFDPIAALEAPEMVMVEKNPWLKDCSRLDTVAQFALHLPPGDPQRVEPVVSRKRPLSNTGGEVIAKCKKTPSELHPFEAIAQCVQGGPLSRLQCFRKQRVRIVIRYVNAIRGELYGILVAFDKHMNMILRDAEEIYSMRPVDRELSNVEMELDRRRQLADENCLCTDGTWYGKKRRMKHLLVRGDNVVSISISDQEKKVTKSRYVVKRTEVMEGVEK